MLRIYTDVRTTRRLRVHALLDEQAQTLATEQRLMPLIQKALEMGHTQLKLIDTETGDSVTVNLTGWHVAKFDSDHGQDALPF